MSKNLSLRRILVLVITSVLLSAMITVSLYSYISPSIFAEAKLHELSPRVEYLAEQAALYFESGDGTVYMRPFALTSEEWGATVFLLDEHRNVIASSDAYPREDDGLNIVYMEDQVQRVLAGEEIREAGYIMRGGPKVRNVTLVFIGIPVVVAGKVAGAVIVLKPLDEITSALSTLTVTLWFSALVVLLAMMPLVYWLTARITTPIRQMRDVALRMASGDFVVRANDQERGEMGDLARALNYLSAELGNNIAALTYERNQAVAIVNALGEGILAVDRNMTPRQTNPALQQILTQAGGGRPLPLPQHVWDDYRAALTEARPVDRSFPLGQLVIHLTITPIVDMRRVVVSAVGVFRDETQAVRLEQTRRDYVANVSHELRTPLTAVRALIEPLRDGLIRTEDKRQETYDIILRETLRLSRLVDDMLELSRLQQGRLALEKMTFDLAPLLSDVASVYAAKAADTGHALELDLPEEKMPIVCGNPDRVDQVLVALLNNAFTYTPRGSSILLRAVPEKEFVRVVVEDNGPGILPEDLPHVFDRFYRADRAHVTSGGTGLGLAISREVLEKLGETLNVENCEDGGARFWFTVHYAE